MHQGPPFWEHKVGHLTTSSCWQEKSHKSEQTAIFPPNWGPLFSLAISHPNYKHVNAPPDHEIEHWNNQLGCQIQRSYVLFLGKKTCPHVLLVRGIGVGGILLHRAITKQRRSARVTAVEGVQKSVRRVAAWFPSIKRNLTAKVLTDIRKTCPRASTSIVRDFNRERTSQNWLFWAISDSAVWDDWHAHTQWLAPTNRRLSVHGVLTPLTNTLARIKGNKNVEKNPNVWAGVDASNGLSDSPSCYLRWSWLWMQLIGRWERGTRAPGVSAFVKRKESVETPPRPSSGEKHRPEAQYMSAGCWSHVTGTSKLAVWDGFTKESANEWETASWTPNTLYWSNTPPLNSN